MAHRKASAADNTYAFYEYEQVYPLHVLRSVQDEVWAAIRPLAADEMCLDALKVRLSGRSRNELRQIAAKAASCVRQADEYFSSAVRASPRTAPLLHYYSMLNLSKALIYLERPERLVHENDLLHGLTDRNRVKDRKTFSLKNERVTVQQRGVFNSLHFVLAGKELKAQTAYSVTELFPYCTWLTSELEDVFGRPSRLIHVSVRLALNRESNRIFVTAAVPKDEVVARLKRASRFATEAPEFFSLFDPVASDDPSVLSYESSSVPADQPGELAAALRTLRLYRYFKYSEDSGEYVLPLGTEPLPEPCVLFAVTFYLGSLVRYQPHIYDHLLGTKDAYLLESFIGQCPIAFSYVMLNHLWRAEHLLRPLQ